MSAEEKNENEQAEETPAEQPAAEAPEAPVEEPAAEEAPAEEAPAEEPAAEQAPAEKPAAAAAPAEDAEPVEQLSPKQARKLRRGAHAGEAGPERSAEQRADDRASARAKKAAERRRRRSKARGAHTPGTGTVPTEREPGAKKVRQGKVVSSRADKTITVQVEVVRRHPVYEKVIRRSTTIHAHDERNEANAGDIVRVIESRPLSRTKRWRLTEILERAR